MSKISKVLALATVSISGILLMTSSAFAHVVVHPGETLPAKYTTFSVSVPNERSVPTIEVKVEIPAGVTSVMPTVKSGWDITIEQIGESDDLHGDSEVVKSITWSGGSVPKGQRDDFTFSAKAPDSEGVLRWNAFQTYQDGLVVAWDRSDEDQPKKDDGSPDYSASGPFSVTNVNKVSQEATTVFADNTNSTAVKDADKTLYIAISALVVSFISLILATGQGTAKSGKR